MEPCTILDLSDLAEAVTNTLGVDGFQYVRNDLQGPNMWFLKDGLAVQFQILGNYKCTVHLYGVSRDTLRETRDFILQAAFYMVDNTPIECVLVFCKEADLKLRFLIRSTGAREGTVIPNANGVGSNEILYVYTKEDRKIYEEKLRCHKQQS